MNFSKLETSSLGQKRIIQGGFIIILLLMLMSFALSIIYLNNANTSLTTIAKYNYQKIGLAYAMRDAIRKRQIILSDMHSTEDPFERDEMYMRFSRHALEYISSKDKILSLPMSQHEKILHERLSAEINIAQPLNRIAVDLLRLDISKSDDIIASINNARKAQDGLLKTVEELVEIQNSYSKNAVATGEKEFEFTIIHAIFSAIFITIASSFIAYTISSVVDKKNQELREKNQQLEDATNYKTEFVANMSHEIRTPLTAIIGFAETCMYSGQTEVERKEAIQTIFNSGKHLLHIVNDVLDLSKIEAHKLEYENIDHAPYQVLYEIEAVAESQAIGKDVEFGVNIVYPIPREIRSDPLRIHQILLNLCTNAIKFTHHGHVYLNINYDQVAKSMHYDVIDTGIGIPEDKLTTIFMPFEQAETSTTRNFGGTGLGLTLSAQLATGLGGALTASSVEGQGSRFTLTLPLTHVASELIYSKQQIPLDEKIEPDTLQPESYSGMVLLAEDNMNNQKLMTLYLSQLGLDVDIANNGIEALQKNKDNSYDLIFMDMRMPEMDGVTATSEIRAYDKTTPIIALTANVLKSDQDSFFAVGCNGFLSKPVDTVKLGEQISKHLSLSNDVDEHCQPIISTLLQSGDFHELILAFVNSLPNDIDHAFEMFKSGNYEELENILHNIKGVSGNYGFSDVTMLVERMESLILSNNTVELESLFREFTVLHNRMVSGLEDSTPTKNTQSS